MAGSHSVGSLFVNIGGSTKGLSKALSSAKKTEERRKYPGGGNKLQTNGQKLLWQSTISFLRREIQNLISNLNEDKRQDTEDTE